jgi:hypothetical protein
LKLSSLDAVMYVYKKTLFGLNHEKKKTSVGLNDEDKEKHNILGVYNKLYKNIIFYIINHNEFLLQNKKETIQTILESFENNCNNFNFFCGNDLSKITHVYEFVNSITRFDIDVETFLKMILLYTKKHVKKPSNKQKLADLEYGFEITDADYFVEWLYI